MNDCYWLSCGRFTNPIRADAATEATIAMINGIKKEPVASLIWPANRWARIAPVP
jgi:hypothetical protein